MKKIGDRAEALPWRALPLMFAASMAVMILLLPFFPSQDGPVHLYYVDVVRGLLTHSGPYPQHFAIKSYVTPYAFEYYCLLALETVFPPLVSEKLLICTYVLTFVLSFQFLVGSVTESSGRWALAGAMFCLNSYLYLGFLNFLLATALTLALCGCWIRWMNALTPARSVILILAFALNLLTHPLPGAIFLSFAALHLGVHLAQQTVIRGGTAKEALRARGRPVAVLAAMGAASVVWILQFRNLSTAVIGTKPSGSLRLAVQAIKLMWLTPLLNPPYVAVLQVLVGCAAAVLVIGLWKRRCRVEASVVSAATAAGICLALSCAAPWWVNGSGYFAPRFAIYWVVFLLVAAAAAKPPRWCATVIGGIALCAAPVVILFQSSALSSATRQLSVVMDAPLAPTGSLGVIVAEPGRGAQFGADFVSGSAAHWFRRSQAILTNAPWMDLPMIMLRPKETYPWTYSDDLEKAPERVLAGLDRAGGLRVAVRVHEGGPLTHSLVQRLGFRVVSSTPEIAFYSRP